MNPVIFLVEEDPEGVFCTIDRESIFTQAESIAKLRVSSVSLD
jgi:hypothetical protein